MIHKEWFPLVNEVGETIGKATRGECHNGSKLLHPVIHLHVFNHAGDLYLQKRSKNKDIQPGKWDTAVGGHIDFGETATDALHREAREELNMTNFTPAFLQQYIFESEIEREFVYTFKTIYTGSIQPDQDEVEDGRFWSLEKIRSKMKLGVFTPNFEYEFLNILSL